MNFLSFIEFLLEKEEYDVKFDKTKHHWITIRDNKHAQRKVFIDD